MKRKHYNSDDVMAHQVRQLIALAYVPADQISQYYTSIKPLIDDRLMEIMKYVEVSNYKFSFNF